MGDIAKNLDISKEVVASKPSNSAEYLGPLSVKAQWDLIIFQSGVKIPLISRQSSFPTFHLLQVRAAGTAGPPRLGLG